MPKPRKGESLSDYVGRAIPIMKQEHPEWKQKQVIAVAYSMYREHKKKK
jgi:hypothetical protein